MTRLASRTASGGQGNGERGRKDLLSPRLSAKARYCPKWEATWLIDARRGAPLHSRGTASALHRTSLVTPASRA